MTIMTQQLLYNNNITKILPLLTLFNTIYIKRTKITLAILIKELSYTNYNIIINEYSTEPELFLLYTNNPVFNNAQLCIFEKKTLKPLLIFYNTPVSTDFTYNNSCYSENQKSTNIIVNEIYFYEKHICLFNYNNKWYITYQYNISLCSSDKLSNNIVKIFLELIDNKIDLHTCDPNLCYHFTVHHSYFKPYGLYDSSIKSNIFFLYATKKYDLTLEQCLVMCNHKQKQLIFSDFNEIKSSLAIINNDTIENKQLIIIGFSIYNLDISTQENIHEIKNIYTNIYIKINNTMPAHKNQHWCYLELYNENKLNNILPYIHKYYYDIIKRINITLKILSKEILNIYHLTRKKQNSDLYFHLSHNFKKILYELHRIYVSKKYLFMDEEVIDNIYDDDYFLLDLNYNKKQSISIVIVHNYLKSLPVKQLIQLFFDRKLLLATLSDINYQHCNKIFNNSIDMIIIIELLSQ